MMKSYKNALIEKDNILKDNNKKKSEFTSELSKKTKNLIGSPAALGRSINLRKDFIIILGLKVITEQKYNIIILSQKYGMKIFSLRAWILLNTQRKRIFWLGSNFGLLN